VHERIAETITQLQFCFWWSLGQASEPILVCWCSG